MLADLLARARRSVARIVKLRAPRRRLPLAFAIVAIMILLGASLATSIQARNKAEPPSGAILSNKLEAV